VAYSVPWEQSSCLLEAAPPAQRKCYERVSCVPAADSWGAQGNLAIYTATTLESGPQNKTETVEEAAEEAENGEK
jgi:hypothetical protein